MQIIQFILFGILGLFAVFLLASGAITYLFYSLSSSTEIPPLTIPNWQELPSVPSKVFVAGIAILAAIWVLIGEELGKKEDTNSKQRQGRRRNRDRDND